MPKHILARIVLVFWFARISQKLAWFLAVPPTSLLLTNLLCSEKEWPKVPIPMKIGPGKKTSSALLSGTPSPIFWTPPPRALI